MAMLSCQVNLLSWPEDVKSGNEICLYAFSSDAKTSNQLFFIISLLVDNSCILSNVMQGTVQKLHLQFSH